MAKTTANASSTRTVWTATENPELAKRLLDCIVDYSAKHAAAEIKAGAQALQLFDTWAELLSAGEDMDRHIEHVAIGSGQARHVLEKIGPGSLLIVQGDREDVIQEGMIGLYKAIRDYDPTRLSSFRSFAELCVTRQLITAIIIEPRTARTIFTLRPSRDLSGAICCGS